MVSQGQSCGFAGAMTSLEMRSQTSCEKRMSWKCGLDLFSWKRKRGRVLGSVEGFGSNITGDNKLPSSELPVKQ